MAAGPWTIFSQNKVRILNGTFDFDSHSLKLIFLDQSVTPDFAADAVLADVSAGEVGTRVTLANVALNTTAVPGSVRLTADAAVMSSEDPINVKWVVLFDEDSAGDALIAGFDTSVGVAEGVAVTQLTINFPTGIFTL
jgi:hypothetical protein